MIVLFKLIVTFVCVGALLFCANALARGHMALMGNVRRNELPSRLALLVTLISGTALTVLLMTVAPGVLGSTMSPGRLALSGGEAATARVVLLFGGLYLLCLLISLRRAHRSPG